MADFTQLSPTAGLPAGDYGSFVKGGGAHDPGSLTELSPHGGLPCGLYGSFAGKQQGSQGPLTELSPHGGLPMGLYGSFGGKEPGVTPEPEPPVIDVGGGWPYPVYRPPTQYASLHPYETPDEYRRLLVSVGPLRARLRPFSEAQRYTALQITPGSVTASVVPFETPDQFGTVSAERGAMNQNVLRLFVIIQGN